MKEINFNPSNKQFEAWQYLTDNETTELGYGGAASGGKSYLGCFWILAMCLAYPDTGWLMGRRELTNLKRTTLLTFFKVCSEYGIEPEKHFNYNQQNNIITFLNGSQIFLMDLGYKPSDPLFTRLGGLELTGYFIDEANEVPVEAVNIVKTRTGRRNNDKHKIKPKGLETFNPDKGHVYMRFFKPWKDGTLPKHRKFIRALPQDNPFTSEDYLEQLRNSDKITRERLLEGNFEYENDPTILMKYDAINDLFTNTTIKRNQKFISADIARFGDDKTVIYVWDDLEVTKCEILTKTPVDVIADKIKGLTMEYQIPLSRVIVDEDGVGGGVCDILSGVKGFVANSSPIQLGRLDNEYRPNFSNLKAQCYFKLSDFVNTRKIAFKVDDSSIKSALVEELSQIKRKDPDKDTKLAIIPKDDMKANLGRSPDFADALMMRMYFELDSPSPLGITLMQRAGSIRNQRNRGIINDAR